MLSTSRENDHLKLTCIYYFNHYFIFVQFSLKNNHRQFKCYKCPQSSLQLCWFCSKSAEVNGKNTSAFAVNKGK